MPLRSLTSAAVLVLSLTLGVATASAKAPKPATQAATGVTPVGATLNGTVNPRGKDSVGWFQFGTTKEYGNHTPRQSVGAGTAPIGIAAGISGLTSGKTYHFRTVGKNDDGKTVGADKTFKTAAPTSTPVFTPNPVTYGQPVTVSGQIVGSKVGGAEVSLFGRPFPFTDPFVKFGNTVLADGAGNYLFVLASALATSQFEVRGDTNPPFTSSIETLQVNSRISLHVRKRSRKGRKVLFHGNVAPAQDGIVVEVQKLKRDDQFHRIGLTVLTHRADAASSHYRLKRRLNKRGTFRAVVLSNGGAVSPGVSPVRSVHVFRRHHR